MSDRHLPPDWRVTPTRVALSETVDWSLAKFGIPALWSQTRGRGITVAVLDTGCDVNHPDLRDAIEDAQDFTGSPFGPLDRAAHGSWCCGLIGSRTNGLGVQGVANECRILSGKVLDDNGSGSDRDIVRGFQWADEGDADVISMSLGGSQPMPALLAAFISFLSKRPGRAILCAAGNEGHAGGQDTEGYPARYREAVSVAALGRDGRLTSFSAWNGKQIGGPGADMLSTIPTHMGGYGTMSGTSMATPFVAAVVALMLAKHKASGGKTPTETPEQIKEHLFRTATKNQEGVPVVAPAALLAASAGQQPKRDSTTVSVAKTLLLWGGCTISQPPKTDDNFSVKVPV